MPALKELAPKVSMQEKISATILALENPAYPRRAGVWHKKSKKIKS